jgi:hypothetical protein
MPRKKHPAPWYRAVWEQYPCTRCGAAPGAPCTSDSGTAKHEPHADRAALASADGWRLMPPPDPPRTRR